jgi:hypothetical protein
LILATKRKNRTHLVQVLRQFAVLTRDIQRRAR